MPTTSTAIDEAPPASEHLTDYDRRHLTTYARLLDAAADEADWREVATVVLGLDPSASSPTAANAFTPRISSGLVG